MFCVKEKSDSNEQSKDDKPGVARGPTGIPNPVCSPETSVAPGLSSLGGKMDNSLLWYPWWPNRWAGSTAAKMMSLEERGAYHELLDWQWQGRGYLPGDPVLIARLCGFDPTLYPAVLKQFPLTDDGRRSNPVLLQIWETQIRRHKNRSDSAKKRWNKDKETETETETETHGHALHIQGHEGSLDDANGEKESKKPKKPVKEAYGEFKKVLLTAEEHRKLIDTHGTGRATKAIEILDGYIASKGAKYVSHYAVFKSDSWIWGRVDEGKSTADRRREEKAAKECPEPDYSKLIRSY